MPRLSLLVCAFLLPIFAQAAQYTPAVAEWNRPVDPFRVVGNVYYVGASGVSSYLISTSEGLILLDCGFSETVPLIEANITKLGFRLEDLHLLLISHGHYDHVGGMAELQRRTHARLLANPAEFALLKRGGLGDFAFQDRYAFPPVTPDGEIKDGEQVRLGDTALTAHFTPGHTKGSTTWSLDVRDEGRVLHVVISASLTAPGYRLINNSLYPEIMEDFGESFSLLRNLPCDVFLTLHGWDFDLDAKRRLLGKTAGANPFIDAAALTKFADKSETALQRQHAQQRAAAKPRKE